MISRKTYRNMENREDMLKFSSLMVSAVIFIKGTSLFE
jgi:hypothetical protein